MADNPPTGKEEEEEEEVQEGKATVSATGSPSQNASKAGSDSATRNGPPALSQHSSANAKPTAPPVVAENVSESGTGSPLPSSAASKNVSARTVSLSNENRSQSSPLILSNSSQNAAWSGARSSMRDVPESGGNSTTSPLLRTPSKSGTAAATAAATLSSPSVGVTDVSGRSIAPQSLPKTPSVQTVIEAQSKNEPRTEDSLRESARGTTPLQSSSNVSKRLVTSKAPLKDNSLKETGQSQSAAPQAPVFGSSRLFERRSPFVHNPPYPEERRSRISNPQCPRDYIINLREDLADFQESHGLPRTRDYSFMSLGLSLAQETGRAIYAVFLMITELFPVIAILSLILRFSLDKIIEILETDGTVARVKKSAIFAFQILIIMIPLWILVGTIIFPLLFLILSIFRRLFRLSGHKKGKARIATRPVPHHHHHPPPVKVKK